MPAGSQARLLMTAARLVEGGRLAKERKACEGAGVRDRCMQLRAAQTRRAQDDQGSTVGEVTCGDQVLLWSRSVPTCTKDAGVEHTRDHQQSEWARRLFPVLIADLRAQADRLRALDSGKEPREGWRECHSAEWPYVSKAGGSEKD